MRSENEGNVREKNTDNNAQIRSTTLVVLAVAAVSMDLAH